MLGAWLVVLALILRHRIFVSHDTVSNYAHVWYVADRLWHAHQLPFGMPIIGHGDALAFPYAFLPWVTAALLWPLFGNWAVTLWLVVGFAGVVAATFWAFPELRRGWWAAAVLVNPALVLAPIVGQLPFLWAGAFLLGAVGCWRRGRKGWATALAAVAQATHPAVVIPITAGVVALTAIGDRHRRSLLTRYGVSVLVALPAAAQVVLSPVFRDSSSSTRAAAFLGTVAMRSAVVAGPFLLLLLRRAAPAWIAPLVFLVLLAPNFMLDTLDTRFPWRSLWLGPDVQLLSFIQSPAFVPGATYRVLRAHDGKIGMYQLIQHGARLDSEFFPESIVRRSWPDERSYARFLDRRHVDYVIAFDEYTRRYHTNEIALLGGMPACASRVGVDLGPHAPNAATGPGFELFRVRTPCDPS